MDLFPADLLSHLRRKGVTFRLDRQGDHWTFMAYPSRLLTEADRKALKEHRDGIIDALWSEGDEAALRRAPAWPSIGEDWRGVTGEYEE